MNNGQGQGGGRPPQDDRTLLDPLSNDELRALREARQRMQAKKESGSAVAHQIVIGPDSGEDIGDAPTRALPSLPSFDSSVSIDQISAPPQQRVTAPAQDPATMADGDRPPGATLSDPAAAMNHADTVAPTVPSPAQRRPNNPQTMAPGQPGFGENTLMWMQPPKLPTSSHGVAPLGAGEFIPRANTRDVAYGKAKTYGAAAVIVMLVGALIYFSLFSSPKGVVELHSTPPKAAVYIEGTQYEETPVRLTLSEGSYRISLKLAGYETAWMTTNVKADETQRRDVTLTPLSRPGLKTVKVEVSPVAAKITVDGQPHQNQKILMVPNVDPTKRHKIVVEAAGYVKIIQEIRPDELKSSYTFRLAKSPS